LILHHGEVAEGRGCETLVRALPALNLPPHETGAHLVFLGAEDSRYILRLRGLARIHGVGDHVHFVPPVPLDRLLDYTVEADIGVCMLEPTCENHRLALPNKLFEYVAGGVPVVASDIPEVASLVREHGIGWTVDPRDPATVADGLRTALRGCASLALRARIDAAAQELSWHREQQALLELYKSLRPPRLPRTLLR
jgi:glycosyltransferase involved in cell wall biosynthesis